MHVRRKMQLQENIKTVYNVVWGQCTEALRSRIEAMPSHSRMSAESNGLDLLKAIKMLIYNFGQETKYGTLSIHNAKRRYYTCQQSRQSTVKEYMVEYKNRIDVVNQVGGTIGQDAEMVQAYSDIAGIQDWHGATDAQRNIILEQTHDATMAVGFLI